MRYLIYCGPGIGDWIITLPMARRIKVADSNAYITVIMASDSERIGLTKELLRLQKDIDDIEYYSAREMVHFFDFFMHIGIKKYDYGFVMRYTDTKNISVWPSRIVRIAAKKTCGVKLHSKPKEKYDFEVVREDGVRIVDYFMLMLDRLGIGKNDECSQNDFLKKNLILKEAESLKLPSNGQKTVALVLGAAPVCGVIDGVKYSNPAKNWTYEKWIELAVKFVRANYNVLLLGGKKEASDLGKQYDLEKIQGDIVNFVGNCSMVESMAAILKSDIIIGADTGLMHCAGALDAKSLTLFGCTDYREYLAYGKHSYYLTSDCDCSPCFGTDRALTCESHACMNKLEVEEVFEYAVQLLSIEVE